jgi:membrane associated rhomboid family serine protease
VKKHVHHPFGSTLEAIVYPSGILIVMWLTYLLSQHFDWRLVQFGVLPRTTEGLSGILFMPWIHSPSDINHILNNSLPILILSSTIIYFYRDIALRVLLLSWLLSGIGVWFIARNTGSYHIGMSGVIYALATFVFFSGAIRKYLPLQAMALFVAFVYGGMIWGVLPTEERISWEGHLSGVIFGLMLALWYAKKGPQSPKFQYEIEKEMGIEPPDLEGQYLEKVRLAQERTRLIEEERKRSISQNFNIIYEFKPNPPTPNENDSSKRQDP